jgi:DnaJ-class molecular chaperone
MTTHYQTLGIDRTANEDDIKRAYRKMAMKHHPDRGGDQAEFQKIQEAYSVLSDPVKRQQYDNPQPQPQFHHFHGGGGPMPPGFEDLFRQFGFQFGGDPFQRQPRNRILNLQTTISLEESFNGKELIANIILPSGREQIINVRIPPGVADGMTLRLREIGDDSVPSAPRGDVHLTISVPPHHTFQRQDDDLIKEVSITAFDAMLGSIIPITTIDNKTLEVTINPSTQHGTTLSIQGHGMPNVNDPRFRGRLLLKIKVIIPTLSNSQRELITQAKLLQSRNF